MSKSTELSNVITTEAAIAMPEIVAIFLSKYETDLYNKKTELTSIIKGIKHEIADHVKTTEKSVSFAEYNKMGIKELGVTCEVSQNANIDWEKNTISRCVAIKIKRDSATQDYYGRNSGTEKVITKPILKSASQKYHKLEKDLDDRKDELSVIVMQITDMSRKEREIKGRISELRLKEQGLESFINSPDMLKLIKID